MQRLVLAAILAVATSTASAAPCFRGPPLAAGTVFDHLKGYGRGVSFWDGDSPLPKARYGQCKVEDGELKSRTGKTLARMHCGLEVLERGIVDHLGLEIGARGRDVIARQEAVRHTSGRAHPEATHTLTCTSYQKGARCAFQPQDSALEPQTRYIVAGKLAAHKVLRGEEAKKFFAPRRVRGFMMTGYCH